ncbi:MAG: hypothetical protein A2W80_09930 [Candidatus Riflebacteria bacterium GWC2_50_8]|nr:MAG: hypothetical protein A2W80_09930 [Candidatus Riflebacteria bacterium GWC2_50_8]
MSKKKSFVLPIVLILIMILSLKCSGDQSANGNQPKKSIEISLNAQAGPIMIFVEIPAGKFAMGSPDTEIGHKGREYLHSVTISKPFYMSKCEVTQEQYQQIMGVNPSKFVSKSMELEGTSPETAKQPVETVSWFDAVRFCNALSLNQGLQPCYTNQIGSTTIEDSDIVVCDWSGTGFRLPTEAEWEYACRAGTTSMYFWADSYDEAEMMKYAWYGRNSNQRCNPDPSDTNRGPQTVGTKLANAFGLYDMIGNVSEWCWDFYDPGYYRVSPDTDPKGPDDERYRVSRGGSWFCALPLPFCSAHRVNQDPFLGNEVTGFRVIRQPE